MAKAGGGSRVSYSSSSVGSASWATIREAKRGPTGNKEGYVVTDASNLLDTDSMAAVLIRGDGRGTLVAGNAKISHASMLYYAGFDSIRQDDAVRFRMYKDPDGSKVMMVNTSFAAVRDYDLPRAEFNQQALDNIYSAVRRMRGKGLPANTKIRVYGIRTDATRYEFDAGDA